MTPSSLEETNLQNVTIDEIEQFVICLEEKAEITEDDLDHITRIIERTPIAPGKLSKMMHLIGIILIERPEKWLQERGKWLIAAAYAKPRSSSYDLNHSLPDTGTRTLIIDTVERDFNHSLILEKEFYEYIEKDPEEIGGLSPSKNQNDLEQSGIFEWEEARTESAAAERSEMSEPISLPAFHDHRTTTLEKIRNGIKFDDDERIRSAKTHSLSDIRKALGSSIGETARKIREHSFTDESQLEETVLKALKELKQLIDRLLQTAHEDLIRNIIPGQGTIIFSRFFEENGKTIDFITEVNKAIELLEEDCQEITEMKLEMEFLIDMLLEASEEYESWNKEKNKNDLYTQALRNTVYARVKANLNHEAEIHNRLTNIQSRFRELFKKIWKVKLHIPDPWAK